jgi:photosystem II stability/assembly factor-like uncharacterized protein
MLVLIAAAAGAASAAWVSLGPDGGYVQAFGIDPQAPARLYAACYDYPEDSRVFGSTDAGASWSMLGRIPYSSVTSLTIDPFDPDVIYAAGRGSGLYRSDDGGANWVLCNLPGYGQSFDWDASVAGRVYSGGYYLNGSSYCAALFISTDWGSSWSVSMPRPDTVFYAYACGADPSRSGTVYLGSNYGYIHRTTDAGASWTQTNAGIPSTASVQALTVNSDGSVVLAATSAGIFRSTDQGASWTLGAGSPASVMSARFSPGDARHAWTLGRADSMRVYVTTDAGATWVRPVPGFVTSKTASLVPHPEVPTSAFLGTQTGIFRSTDQGANWHTAHTGLRIAKISTITAGPWDSDRAYLEMSENGVFKTQDRGTNWTRCNDFLSCGNICGIGVAPEPGGDALYALEGSG